MESNSSTYEPLDENSQLLAQNFCKYVLVPCFKAIHVTLSEKSSVSGGSQTPFTDKSIKSVQCTALKLIIGIFLNLFLTGFSLLKEYKK